jgi:hypothetical protein
MYTVFRVPVPAEQCPEGEKQGVYKNTIHPFITKLEKRKPAIEYDNPYYARRKQCPPYSWDRLHIPLRGNPCYKGNNQSQERRLLPGIHGVRAHF